MANHLLLLNEVAGLIGRATTLQGVLEGVVQMIAERMRTDVCTIWLLSASRDRLRLAATQGLDRSAVGRATLEKGRGLTWAVLEGSKPVAREDATKDPRYVYLPETREQEFHAYLGVPLQVRGLRIGVLVVQTREVRRFRRDELHALSAIASQIASVVDNARLLEMIASEESPREAPHLPVEGPRQASGTGCSSGVVVGPVLRLGVRSEPAAPPTGDAAEEARRLREATAQARQELLGMQDWLRHRNAEEAALVFSVQLMLLEDPAFEGRMRSAVESGAGAYAAVQAVTEDVVRRFGRLEDVFFRERAADVVDLAERLKRILRRAARIDGDDLRGKIAVLPDLAPSRLVSLCAEGVSAILAGGGGATGHAALLARSLDLPLVVGLGDFVHGVRDGQRVLVDAAAGEVTVDPPQQLVESVTRAASAGVEALQQLVKPGATGSGRLAIEANVSLWGDAVMAREQGADGIGLYRTEFAFLMRPDLPGEDEQTELYRRVVDEIAPRPVTFRLLDAGGDKLVPGLGHAREPNPFLGYRSLRLLLDHAPILLAQARAILSALEGTTGRLLVPMVASVEEFQRVRDLIAQIGGSLPPIGAMVEVPSILMQLDELADEADFLCIGTNDLTQHMLAVDRTNARVTRFFDPCHPSLQRAFRRIADVAHAHGTPLCVCGEAASNPLFLPLWLGLGASGVSVHAKRVRILRALEAELDPACARAVAEECARLRGASDVRARLESLARPEVLAWSRTRRAP